MDSTMHHMQEPQRERIKHTLDHMGEHDGNIKYEKYTCAIQYDGVKATGFRHEITVVHTDIKAKEAYSFQGVGYLYVLINGYGRTGGHTSRMEMK